MDNLIKWQCFHLTLIFLNFIYFRRYGTKCSGCGNGIAPSDLVRKPRDKVFHLNCFTCCICRKQLSTGEQLYVLDDNKFICKDDYMLGKGQAGKWKIDYELLLSFLFFFFFLKSIFTNPSSMYSTWDTKQQFWHSSTDTVKIFQSQLLINTVSSPTTVVKNLESLVLVYIFSLLGW